MASPGFTFATSVVMIAAMPELKTIDQSVPSSSGTIWSSRISALG